MSTFEARSKSFGIGEAELAEEGVEFLSPFGTGQIIRIIDGALKRAAYDRESVITVESLKVIASTQNMAADRREFGYFGGGFHEKY